VRTSNFGLRSLPECTMRIGLIADTHGFLDEALFEYFSQCDEVWHVGDFGSVEVLERLRQFKPVRSVYGNIDGPEVRSQLAEDLHWTCEGLRVYMTHVGGYPAVTIAPPLYFDPLICFILLEPVRRFWLWRLACRN